MRVVGNDAGEKLSILPGILARLDRPAPNYGAGRYTDFNTFYMQAASSTSGGSSGSPVLNVAGRCIALNAGANVSSSASYYFPLDRVIRALECLREEEHVTRGTIQVEFEHKAFDEARRLGLPEEAEKEFRSAYPERAGLLIAKTVVPGGPSDTFLENGDILYRIDSALISHFVELEDYLDGHIGNEILVEVVRDGIVLSMHIKIQDLHSITPSRFISIGNGVVHELSYQMARSFNVRTGAPFVSSAGYTFGVADIPRLSMILRVGDRPTETFDQFVNATESFGPGDEILVKYAKLATPRLLKCVSVKIDSYFETEMYTRNDQTGVWDIKKMEKKTSSHQVKRDAPKLKCFMEVSNVSWAVNHVIRALVFVESRTPHLIENLDSHVHSGVGVVVDNVIGLIICDRSAVPTACCDIQATFGNSVTCDAELVFQHPFRNYVVLHYDVDKTGAGPTIPAVELFEDATNFDAKEVTIVAIGDDHVPVAKKTTMTKVRECYVAPSIPPRFRPINTEMISVEHAIENCHGGVLMEETRGKIYGFWFGIPDARNELIYIGLPACYAISTIKTIRQWVGSSASVIPRMTLLDVELARIPLSKARRQGLSNEWMERFALASSTSHSILSVKSTFNTTMNGVRFADDLKDTQRFICGDIVLTINGIIVTRCLDLFHIEESLSGGEELLEVLVLRDSSEQMLLVAPKLVAVIEPATSVMTRRLMNGHTIRLPNKMSPPSLLSFGGMTLQEPYESTRQQTIQTDFPLSLTPYITMVQTGSPAEVCGLTSGFYVLQIDETSLTDTAQYASFVDACLRAFNSWKASPRARCGHSFIRLKVMNREGVKKVVTLIPDEHYWPMWKFTPQGIKSGCIAFTNDTALI